ncbi:MAG: hypothetical protein O7J95_15660 [Planctomycetota bacterium]|nr:hypothetical protein [Planctomycetota bacterium]
MKRFRLLAIALWGLAASPLVAEGTVVKGRLLDTAESIAAFRQAAGPGKWRRPFADQPFHLELLPEGRSWAGQSDAEGRFSIDTGLSGLPAGARMVVRCERRGETLFSRSFVPGATEAELYLSETTDDPENVTCEILALYDLTGTGDELRFRVRLDVSFENASGFLYVGRKRGSRWREIFRLAVPPDAEVVESSGPFPGLDWKRSDDGKWVVIDEPLPGMLDQALLEKQGQTWGWRLTYLTRASQYMSATFQVPVRCDRLVLAARKDAIKILPAPELASPLTFPTDPLTKEPASFDVYTLNREHARLERGHRLVLGIEVSSSAIGQVSFRALKWHIGFLLVSLVGILLGMILSPRKPAVDLALAGLSRDELLDRVAGLDRRFEAGKIQEGEYERYREALLGIIGEELEAAESAGARPSPSPSPVAESAAVRSLVHRIREIDRGATSPETIQERAHLLESLYNALGEESGK